MSPHARSTTLARLGAQIQDYRDLPRPHIALLIGRRPLAPIIDRIRADAGSADLNVVAADLTGIEPADVLWRIGTAIFELIDPDAPVRPRDEHPALAFKRLFNAVVKMSDDDFLLIIGPVDDLEATPEQADNIYGALRAAVVEHERRVQVVFLLRNDIIRRNIFWLDRPMMEFASFLNLTGQRPAGTPGKKDEPSS
ncbi:hypothetical protein [Hydrocarboniphaga effusa]|uniref:hypothetical protein n=1 Tax=Hydrocarboniphaga effusa TaxID=243629 RepID=UPI00398C1B8B